MDSSSFHYLYGPVPSRRLGRSLGIDLVPYKTCTYDCIYCQIGKTTDKTIERRDYVPLNNVLEELKQKLSSGHACDVITLAGSGEPTLHASLGELIYKIKEITDIPVAVITNGSLLYLPEVRQALLEADLVIPSLDVGDAALFEYVNRPHPDIDFNRMIEGLILFSEQFRKRLWLEVLLVSGVTGLASEVKKIAAWAQKIHAEKVQLGTVSRPAREDFACAVDARQMKILADYFPPPVDLLENSLSNRPADAGTDFADTDILNLLARRPSTLEGLCAGLGLHAQQAAKALEGLMQKGLVKTLRVEKDLFYASVQRDNADGAGKEKEIS